MLGLDLVSIIAGAIAGAIGGAIGGGLGLLTQSRGLRIGLILVLALLAALVGAPLISPYLEQSVGTSVRANQFDATYANEVQPELEKIPALKRIFQEHPDVEAQFRAKAREAYEKGGAKGLLEQSSAIGATVLGSVFLTYMPRARGEDLILFAATEADILGAMNTNDPEACLLYQFGARYGRALGTERLLKAIGAEREKKQLDAMNAIVMNAADKPIPFDDAKAAPALAAMGKRHAPLLTGQSAEVAQGARPPADEAEARVACSFAAALFKDLATMDAATAELILRKMFSQAS